MATNRYLRHLLLAFLILAGTSSLWAQNAGYFIDTEGGETRFIQRLVWTGGEYALRYEVVIERAVGTTSVTFLREFTEASFIEVSLPPGYYRFQIISYNILDRPEEVSQWINIEVRPAVQPEISDVLLDLVSGGSYDETSGLVLNILGENFTSDSEFIIQNSDGTRIIPEVLNSGADGASLFIAGGAYTPGEYELVVINPGGLETGMGGIVLPQIEKGEYISQSGPEKEKEDEIPTERPPVERPPRKPRTSLIFVNVEWSPVFPLHGTFFGTNASFAGAGARFGIVYPLPNGIYLGWELTAFWNNAYNAIYDYSSDVLSVGANLVAMKWLPNKTMALTYRLGLSYLLLSDTFILPNTQYIYTQGQFMLNIGTSYLWRFSGIFTLEAGIDYAVLLGGSSFDGGLHPWLGVGLIF